MPQCVSNIDKWTDLVINVYYVIRFITKICALLSMPTTLHE